MRVMSRSEPPAFSERLVPVHPRRARLVQEHVRERVREVARHRDEPVVRLGVDRDRDGAERRDEAVQHLVAVRVRRGDRRQEPGRAVEQLAGRALRPARLRAADRMAADEARIAAGRRARPTPFVEPTSVTTVQPGAAASSTARTWPGSDRDRRRDDRELGARREPRRDRPPPRPRRARPHAARCAASGSQPADAARRRPAAPRARRTRRSGRCRRSRAARSPDRLAEQGRERADLVREVGEVGRRDLLRPVAERLLGPAGAPRR